jgi:hypothetical protein
LGPKLGKLPVAILVTSLSQELRTKKETKSRMRTKGNYEKINTKKWGKNRKSYRISICERVILQHT